MNHWIHRLRNRPAMITAITNEITVPMKPVESDDMSKKLGKAYRFSATEGAIVFASMAYCAMFSKKAGFTNVQNKLHTKGQSNVTTAVIPKPFNNARRKRIPCIGASSSEQMPRYRIPTAGTAKKSDRYSW